LFVFHQSCFPYGRSRGRLRQPVGSVGHVLRKAITDGGQLKKATVHPRGHKFNIPEYRDCAIFASDLLQGVDDQNGKLAHINPK